MTVPARPTDRLGRQIEVGDFIVYAGQRGQSACLNYGKVIDLPVKSKYSYSAKADVPYYKLKVQPWNVSTDEPTQDTKWNAQTRAFDPIQSRPVLLEFSDRVAVISNQ